MRKTLITFVCLVTAALAYAQESDVALVFDKRSWSESKAGYANISANKVKDENGNAAPCIIIKIKNLPFEETKNLKAYLATGGTTKIESDRYGVRNTHEGPELLVWVKEAEGEFDIQVRSGDGGMFSDRLHVPSNLYNGKNGRVYEVDLVYIKKIPIVIKTLPIDVSVYVDGEKAKNINGAHSIETRAGRRKLSFARNGITLRDTAIVVSTQGVNMFEFDVRKRYRVEISSTPRGADVYLLMNGKADSLLGNTTNTLKLYFPEGRHTIRRQYSVKYLKLVDTITFDVTPNERNNIINKPLEQKRNVTFVGKYQGKAVQTTISIRRKDKRINEDYNPGYSDSRINHKAELPDGKYEVTLMDYKHSGSKVFDIRGGQTEVYTIELKPHKREFVWPWKRDFEHKVVGFSLGYVQRSIKFTTSDAYEGTMSIDPAWRNDNAVTQGVRAGLHFQPCLHWGLGLYTGGFFEYYYSPTPNSNKGYNAMDEMFTSFSEMAVSIPIHLYYRIPFSVNFAMALHGGIDAEYYFKATYRDSDGEWLTVTPPYGISGDDDFMYKHLNLGLGFGVSIQWAWALLEANWHLGLTDHEIYSFRFANDDISSHMSKFNASFSILF